MRAMQKRFVGCPRDAVRQSFIIPADDVRDKVGPECFLGLARMSQNHSPCETSQQQLLKPVDPARREACS
jgi:hypothetical protein